MLYDDNRILFFDTHEIDSLEDTQLTLNPPQKRGQCLSIEEPWEMGHCRGCNVIYFDGAYRLYYTISSKDSGRGLAFAVSDDGVNWTRPNLGAVEFKGSKSNNIVSFDSPDFGETCVFVDPHGPDEHRVKCICHHPWQGLWLMTSPDGIHFKRGHEGFLLERGTDNNMTVFWDETIGKYRVYLRGGDKRRSIMGWAGSRSVVYTETEDIHEPLQIDEFAPDPHYYGYERPGLDGKPVRPKAGIFRELPTVMGMDDKDPAEADLYQAAAVHYAPNAYLAFPTLYFHYPGPPEGFMNDGWLDLQFAASRDGRLWRRDLRGSYVRLDMTGEGAWKQMHMLIGMVPRDRSLYQYYMGSKLSHGEGRTPEDRMATKVRHWGPGDPIAFRIEQRMDGFVSADSAYTGGSILTRPFRLNSSQLAVNMDTSASGAAYAALYDGNGFEIKGFSLEESDLIQCNDTRRILTWRQRSDVSRLKGKQIRLMIRSRNTKLYAVYPDSLS